MLEMHRINSRIHYIKYCLVGFTCLFALTGLSLIIIGSTINAVFVEFSYFLDNQYFAPAIFLYSVGFLVFGISIIGLYGSIKENICMIQAYSILLGVIFIFQLATGFATDILIEGTMYDQIRKKLTYLMNHYENEEYAKHVNALQQGIGCCGAYGPNDWGTLIPNTTIPSSCYLNNELFNRGCYVILEYIVTDVANILAKSAYILAFMQFLGSWFAWYLGKSLKEQKLAKEYRRNILTNQLFNPAEKEMLPTVVKE